MVSQKNSILKTFSKSKEMTLKGKSGKVMVREAAPPVCVDWYWTTYSYDSWGNIIEIISEVYLYTTCTEEGGGDGGGCACVIPPDDDVEFVPDFGNPVSIDDGSYSEATIMIGSDSARMANRSWIFHEGLTWWGRSFEKLIVKINNGVRTWHSISHIEHIKAGYYTGGEAKIIKMVMIPHVPVGDSGTAYVEAKYRISIKPSGDNKDTYESEYMYSYATWNTSFTKVAQSN